MSAPEDRRIPILCISPTMIERRNFFSFSGVLPAKSSGEFVLEVAPQFGQLTLDAATGQFVYVPNDTSLTVNDSFSYFVQNSQNQHGSTVVVSVNVVGQ